MTETMADKARRLELLQNNLALYQRRVEEWSKDPRWKADVLRLKADIVDTENLISSLEQELDDYVAMKRIIG